MTGEDVYVVGGANSAGQAALHLARFAAAGDPPGPRAVPWPRPCRTTWCARSRPPATSTVRHHAEVVDGGGERPTHRPGAAGPRTGGHRRPCPAAGLFVLIGAEPHTEWLPGGDASGTGRLRPDRHGTAGRRPPGAAAAVRDQPAGRVRGRRRPARLGRSGWPRRSARGRSPSAWSTPTSTPLAGSGAGTRAAPRTEGPAATPRSALDLIPCNIRRVISRVTGSITRVANLSPIPVAASVRARDNRRHRPAPSGTTWNDHTPFHGCSGGAAQDQRPPDVHPRHREGIAGRHRSVAGGHDDQPFPDREVLPLRVDLPGAVDVQADEVLQPVVAVHPAAVLTDLHQPPPHLVGRCVHRDGSGWSVGRLGDELVAG